MQRDIILKKVYRSVWAALPKAEYTYFKQRQNITVHEFAFLSFGKNPVSFKSIATIVDLKKSERGLKDEPPTTEDEARNVLTPNQNHEYLTLMKKG